MLLYVLMYNAQQALEEGVERGEVSVLQWLKIHIHIL